MAGGGLVHAIKAVDCSLDMNLERGENLFSGVRSLLRDPESRDYDFPSQHFFKDAPQRINAKQTPESIVAMLDDFGVDKAIVGIRHETAEESLRIFEKFPARLYGKLTVDPHEGMEAVKKIQDCAGGNPLVKALNINPFAVQRPPNDKIYYPIYTKAIEMGLPITMTVGLPGPRVPGEIQNPIYLDEPLWFFPDLKIVMMHGGEPWEAMCVKLMLKWPNLYYMTSGFAPKHYPKDVMYYANTRGNDKVMYSGYYPGLPYERLRDELPLLDLRKHVWPKFLRENAIRVFDLDS
ncbi:amidohydrolase family protein [Dehalococcoidia bacterium]|nr:amidohydrolase family protein [Dehalococcoidia bacterium]